MKQLQQDFDIAGELDINVIARIPGALQPARNGIDERIIGALERALDQALDELEKMREQEGEALKNELRERVQKIETLVPIIESLQRRDSPMLIVCGCKNGSENCLIAVDKLSRSIPCVGPGSCLSRRPQ